MKLVIITLPLLLVAAPAYAQEREHHENHEWLQHKYNDRFQSCCTGGKSGDCKTVPFDAYTESPEGGVNYGKHYFPPGSVMPTEDILGRPIMCIWQGQPRCAFVLRGS
jgi:hypothetical protein